MTEKKEDKVNVANAITLFRIFPGLLCAVYILFDNKLTSIMLYLLFLVMDIMDGYAARVFKCETKFGKNFDFFVDGTIGTLVIAALLFAGRVPIAYIVLIAIPLLIKNVFVWRSTRIAGGTFVPAKWRKLNGAVLLLLPLCFMSGDVIVGLGLAYLALIYVYVSSVKYIVEIQTLEKRKSRKRHGLKKK